MQSGSAARQPQQGIQRCPEPEARAFDFYLGEWNIRQKILKADGTWGEFAATTSVSPAIDGCALVEHWHGDVQFFWEGMTAPAPLSGLSVRAYDPRSRAWHIHWMDTMTPYFSDPFTGGFADGRGEFFKELQTPGGMRKGRITFADITPDSLHWSLAISDDDGKHWKTLWIMEMRRR